MTPEENLKCLVTAPARAANFKAALEDADQDTLNTALEMRGLMKSGTAWLAVRKEIKRRMEEADLDTYDLETFEAFQKRWEENDRSVLYQRKRLEKGDFPAYALEDVRLAAKRHLSGERLAAYQEDIFGQTTNQSQLTHQTMKKSPSKSIVTAASALAESPFAPARLHAQRAYQNIAAGAQEAILCGCELIRLYETLGMKQGKRSDLNLPHGVASWAEAVRQEVGISDETARRWMQAARAQLPAIAGNLGYTINGECDLSEDGFIELIAEVEPERLAEVVAKLSNGKTLEQLLLPLDASGQFDPSKLTGKAKDAWEKICYLCDPYDDEHHGPQFFSQEEYDAMHDDALVMKQRVESGELAPTRAWAGLRGRAAADGKGGRNAVDHIKNLHTGLTKLRTSFTAWNDLGGEERAEIEAEWQELWKSMPETWKATIKKLENWK